MNLRAIAAVVGGVIVWPALFSVVGIAFGFAWEDYRAAARQFFASDDFSLFTVSMMLTNFVVFAIAGLATGGLVVRLGRSRTAGLVVAGLWLVYGLVNHYYFEWNNLPDWYNLVVPWVMAVPVYLGGRLGAARREASDALE